MAYAVIDKYRGYAVKHGRFRTILLGILKIHQAVCFFARMHRDCRNKPQVHLRPVLAAAPESTDHPKWVAPTLSRLLACRLVERVSEAEPEQPWRTRRIKGRLLRCELSVDRRERAGDEIAIGVEAGRTQPRRARILPVEQIVDLRDDFDLRARLVAAAKIEDRITGGLAGAEVIAAIRLVRAVFIAAGEHAGQCQHADAGAQRRR